MASEPIHEVSEFIVRRYHSGSQRWIQIQTEREGSPIDLAAIYAPCIEAQSSMIQKANELCENRKMPFLDLTVSHSWSDLEEAVSATCHQLEELSKGDKSAPPGFTGKLREAFRVLCSNAGVGSTIVNLVPTDSYCSVLCGGLKVIFKALEQTGKYRQEVQGALEDLPFILKDNEACLDLDNQDEELHRRVAGLYTSIYGVMEEIFFWFLRRSLKTGARMLINPSGFMGKLNNSIDAVKQKAQRVKARVEDLDRKSRKRFQNQQTQLMIHQICETREFGSRLMMLDRLLDFLQDRARGEQERMLLSEQQASQVEITPAEVSAEEILEKYIYEPGLVPTDSDNILKLRHRPGYDFDEGLVSTIKSHPRLITWLTLNESSLIYVDTRSESRTYSLEMPLVIVEIFQNLGDFARQYASTSDESNANLICLTFFCSQHRDLARDPNAAPTELAMSLLLQLLCQQRYYDPGQLESAFGDLEPTNIESICATFEILLSWVPATTAVYLMVDDLRAFAQPPQRLIETIEVVQRFKHIHSKGNYRSILKFLFANSTRNETLDELFTEDETLRIWESAPVWNDW